MTEQEYREEWLAGLHHTEYNNCRFAKDKIQYVKDWLFKNKLVNEGYEPCTNEIANIVCIEKLRIATDIAYRKLCTKWTDKIQVQEELRKLGLKDLVLDSICKYDEIQPNDVPNNQNSMIKCNHGSNWNVHHLCDSSDTLMSVQRINDWQKLNYAYICGYEAQYEDIKPGYVIQPLLPKPLDYNFWCVDHDVIAVGLTKKLDNDITEHLAFVDVDGKTLDWYVGAKPEMRNLQTMFKKNIDKMLPYVKEIAKLFKFVRIDMFAINGKVKFCEATFTPCGGKIIVQKL